MTAQNIVVIREDDGRFVRFLMGPAVKFETGHLGTAANESFDKSLQREIDIAEMVKQMYPHRD